MTHVIPSWQPTTSGCWLPGESSLILLLACCETTRVPLYFHLCLVFSTCSTMDSNGDNNGNNTSSAPSTPQSANGTDDAPRKCHKCLRRISAYRLDAHVDCVQCRGYDCDLDHRCATCESWSLETMHAYVRHRKLLASKRDYKRRSKAARSSQDSQPLSAGASAASVSDSALPPHSPQKRG